jgi:hypothetical protein
MSELPGQDASMTTLPPPSWQRDPLGRYEYRFWDGTQWSDHVATGGIQGIDPLPHAPVSGSDPKTQQFSAHHPSKRQIAKQGRNQFENLAIKAAHGDTNAMQALPAAATQAREYYRNDKKYLDEAWAVMTVALRDVLTDDVLTEQGTRTSRSSHPLSEYTPQTWPTGTSHCGRRSWWHGSTTDVPYPTTEAPS